MLVGNYDLGERCQTHLALPKLLALELQSSIELDPCTWIEYVGAFDFLGTTHNNWLQVEQSTEGAFAVI